MRSLSKINTKIVYSLYVATNCSLPVEETEDITLLGYVLLLYNKLLSWECMWLLGIIVLSLVTCKMFIHVMVSGNMIFHTYTRCNCSLEEK